MSSRLVVRRTCKLFIGGAFPRSESGRTYEVTDTGGQLIANVAKASRKDARDAVSAARKAFPTWSGLTAYNRGQVLYRVAELMEGRRAQFVDEVTAVGETAAEVDAAIDRWVHYAGWTDKLAQVLGSANPVAGPYFNLSVPEPSGVVAALAPQESSLLGLVSVIAPLIATGNTGVVVTSQERPVPSVSLGEVLQVADVPGGAVNLLTGHTAELAPWLAGHMDVNAIDLTGANSELALDCERAAVENLKRVRSPREEDWLDPPDLSRLTDFLEIKTVWHPRGR